METRPLYNHSRPPQLFPPLRKPSSVTTRSNVPGQRHWSLWEGGPGLWWTAKEEGWRAAASILGWGAVESLTYGLVSSRGRGTWLLPVTALEWGFRSNFWGLVWKFPICKYQYLLIFTNLPKKVLRKYFSLRKERAKLPVHASCTWWYGHLLMGSALALGRLFKFQGSPSIILGEGNEVIINSYLNGKTKLRHSRGKNSTQRGGKASLMNIRDLRDWFCWSRAKYQRRTYIRHVSILLSYAPKLHQIKNALFPPLP